MSRPLRLHVPGATYHVTLRGNHSQDIFFTSTDRDRLSELFAEALERYAARMHAYCFMTNHFHVVIQVSDTPLGRIMQTVAGQYARITQARLLTTGHLFEKRYHTVLVDTDSYLQELLRYLHLNPVRARMVRHPADYPWSSHHAYVGTRSDPWITTDFALGLFSARRNTAIAAYERFVQDAIDHGPVRSPFDERNPGDPRILGSDDFARRTLGAAWRPRSRKSLEQLIAEACEKFSVTEARLRSASRDPHLVAARAWVASEAAEGRVASISAIARHFGRNESSLRRLLRKRSGGS